MFESGSWRILPFTSFLWRFQRRRWRRRVSWLRATSQRYGRSRFQCGKSRSRHGRRELRSICVRSRESITFERVVCHSRDQRIEAQTRDGLVPHPRSWILRRTIWCFSRSISIITSTTFWKECPAPRWARLLIHSAPAYYWCVDFVSRKARRR